MTRTELVQHICDFLAERKPAQVKAAALLGIDQPKVSALMRGKLDDFSIDRLLRFPNVLGHGADLLVAMIENGAAQK